MANTYTQIHIHFVFAVKYRKALIAKEWKIRLHQYIAGIFQKNNHKIIQINSMPDHIHILSGIRPHQSISSLIQNVKAESSRFIKSENYSNQFAWQEGYGAFSYSKRELDYVINYIKNQELHHQKQSFIEEFRQILSECQIEWDSHYIFRDPE